ncbi:MAG: aminotransferase class V-fold PLP-dependent enzyme, partial [Pirellulales bacterium]
MSGPPRIYLDNAATSWPKPDAVYDAVDRYQRECGAAYGRGVYAEATQAARLVEAARQGLAKWLGAGDPRRIAFTCNGTDAINLALHGLLRAGDHVVTTVVEHNSVLRPLRYLEDAGQINVDRVPCDGQGLVDAEAIRLALRPNTRLIALTHVSNVTGAIQPVDAVSAIAQEQGALLLIDAAQSAGHLPLNLARLPADLLAAPGHKGLLGPLGTGFLYVRPGLELRPVRQGGTGSHSNDDHQPADMP